VVVREAAILLKTKQPNAEITVRDLQAGKVTAIEHPAPVMYLDRIGGLRFHTIDIEPS
jgi:hypothetical protein